jgi:hypothetical protein
MGGDGVGCFISVFAKQLLCAANTGTAQKVLVFTHTI